MRLTVEILHRLRNEGTNPSGLPGTLQLCDVGQDFVDWALTIPDAAIRERVIFRNLVELLWMRKLTITTAFKAEDVELTDMGAAKVNNLDEETPASKEQDALSEAMALEEAFGEVAYIMREFDYRLPRETVELVYTTGRSMWEDFPARGDSMAFCPADRWLTRESAEDAPLLPLMEKYNTKEQAEKVVKELKEGTPRPRRNYGYNDIKEYMADKPRLKEALAARIWKAMSAHGGAGYLGGDNGKDFIRHFSSQPSRIEWNGNAADLARFCRYIVALSDGVPVKEARGMKWEYFTSVFKIKDRRSTNSIINTMKATSLKDGEDDKTKLEKVMDSFLAEVLNEKQETIAK